MRSVFADTFYWVAVTDPKDSHHAAAVSIGLQADAAVLTTTDEVLGEYLAYFAGRSANLRLRAGHLAAYALEDPSIGVFEQSRETFRAGLRLYLARPDKGYSLVECISMETMRREGISEVLTNDRHFEQEGFRALFR
jgi:predicted nucleic acid-binding protein